MNSIFDWIFHPFVAIDSTKRKEIETLAWERAIVHGPGWFLNGFGSVQYVNGPDRLRFTGLYC